MKVLALLFAGAISLAAQPARLEFEAASIKPSKDDPGHSGSHTRTGLMQLENQTLRSMIEIAYHIISNQVQEGPKWVETERFNVIAKADHPAEDAELIGMLQTLLADRFKLQFHIQRKEFSGFALTVAKGGLKIHPAESANDKTHSSSDGHHAFIDFDGATFNRLAENLSRRLRIPVVDATGVSGPFTFRVEFAADDLSARNSSSEDNGPSIFTALQEQLGLKLESRKVPLDVLVIDSAEKPGEN